MEDRDGDLLGCNNKNGEIGDRSKISISNGGEKNVEISLATASTMFPGFRFCPTDEELISYYLKKKVEGSDKCVEVISEVEIWKHEPWDLPGKSVVQSDNEWFFFSPRGRKYPNGSQSKRATESGYWKATGKERNVKSGTNMIGTKRTLVFHIGRAPKGQRTHWIMHEYCMMESPHYQDSMVVCRLRKNNEFHLNDTPGNQRNHLAVTNGTTALSRVVQLNGLGLINGVECCSKEASSSFSSHSVEQIESGSESDKLNKELPQLHSSSSWKDCDEEDCFADIMKDDIIKLDESSDKAKHNLLPTITRKLESSTTLPTSQEAQNLMSHRLPFQGTANRRLKLRTEKVPRQVERSEPHEVIKNSHARCISRKLINIIPVRRLKQWSIPLLLVSLMLLVVFLCLFGVPQEVKWYYSS